ncbi:hypothetical protein ACK11Z_04030 [Methanoculleus bourgensis]|uniref:hypothetical protein n=1 Tax=Methanoculleus bourgensis TaxID=83986 RepID=UPI003B966B49
MDEQTNPGPPRRYPAGRTTPVHLPVALRMARLHQPTMEIRTVSPGDARSRSVLPVDR